MAASAKSGPEFIFANLSAMQAAIFGSNGAIPDPDTDAGPSGFYQGLGILDPRILYTKDQVTGFTGVVASHFMAPHLKSIGAVPSATAANNIAANQHVVSGTAMTLAGASVGVDVNIPVIPYSGLVNGAAATTPALLLDFGFGFVNATSGSKTVVVSDSTLFIAGMPLVIAGIGNSAGTAPLLTNVASITDATHIVLNDAALKTNTAAAVGTGNRWGPNENGFPVPLAAAPYLAGGPSLFLDPRQAITRGVRITGAGGSAGGTFLVTMLDIYGQTFTQLVTVGAASTGYTLKTGKAVVSVVPQFTDAQNYEVGTSDEFGFAYRSRNWEDTRVFWNGILMTTAAGWVAADTTNPATDLTGDVRGTIQTSGIGGGSGIGGTTSNGSVSSLVMTGVRLEMAQDINLAAMLSATQANAATLFGQTQV